MSHEIRTPLNGIIGISASCCATSTLTPRPGECAELIGNSADALLIIVNDILDFSKISAGKLVFEEIDFELTPSGGSGGQAARRARSQQRVSS